MGSHGIGKGNLSWKGKGDEGLPDIIAGEMTGSLGKGVYLLVLEAYGPLEVGRLGVLDFDGWYVYVGSALGPGGLKRLQRHFDYRRRSDAPVRWHVDVLLGAGALRGAVAGVTEGLVECRLAEALGEVLGQAFEGFGSSDCGCAAHLFGAGSYEEAVEMGRRAIEGLGLVPKVIP